MYMGFPEEHVNFIQNGSRNFNPYSQTYNPGWRQHPNLRWSDTQPGHVPNNAQQENKPSLGEMFHQYVQKTDKVFQQIDTNFQNQQASIKKLEIQIGQIAQQLSERPQGSLPGNTMTNPKEQVMTIEVMENDPPRAPVKVKAYVPPLPFPQRLRKKSIEENLHAITTRSGVQVPEITVKQPERKEDWEGVDETIMEEKSTPTSIENKESTEALTTNAPSPVKAYVPPIPFPQRLKKNKPDTKFDNFLEVLKKLQINIPLIDAILQIPSYTKFLKEMLTKKRKLPEFEVVALTEESSARVLNKLPPKLKDPGSFCLPISIGNSRTIAALCDTGASINLMSYSVYRKLGLGEVKPTSIKLQLADTTISKPLGKVEDVLIKAGNLIFPVDFIVLDTPENRDIPIILGRPFLATGRTLIDMEKGELILRVEDKQEIFNIYTPLETPSKNNLCCGIDEEKPPGQRSCKNRRPNFGGLLGRDKNGNIKIWRAQKGCMNENCTTCHDGIKWFEPP
jgi:hypothetical protein